MTLRPGLAQEGAPAGGPAPPDGPGVTAGSGPTAGSATEVGPGAAAGDAVRAPDDMLDAFPSPLGDEVREIVARVGSGGTAILPVLEAVQRARGSISDTAFRVAAHALGVRPADLKELAVASGRFTVERGAAHLVVVCVHKHCRARGAPALLDAIGEETGLAPGDTSPGGELCVETVLCVGGCKVGPNALVDGTWVSGLDPDGMRRILEGMAVTRPSN